MSHMLYGSDVGKVRSQDVSECCVAKSAQLLEDTTKLSIGHFVPPAVLHGETSCASCQSPLVSPEIVTQIFHIRTPLAAGDGTSLVCDTEECLRAAGIASCDIGSIMSNADIPIRYEWVEEDPSQCSLNADPSVFVITEEDIEDCRRQYQKLKSAGKLHIVVLDGRDQ